MTPQSSSGTNPLPAPIIVMGVSGCGKTTIGQLLADELGVPYVEADDYHSPANVAKMAQGRPLTDQDRQPWLEAIADRIRQDSHLVASCGAHKRRYRDILRQADPSAWFLHLVLDRQTATDRVARRKAHFMPASLVGSQFEALEPLHDESGLAVDATRPPQEIVATALRALTGLKPHVRRRVSG